MSLLTNSIHRRVPVAAAAVAAFSVHDAQELAEADHHAAMANLAADEGLAKVEELLSRAELSASIDHENKDLVSRDRLELQNLLSQIGYTPDESAEMTVGFESASTKVELGNEAWQTIKKAVTDAINWVIEQLEKAKTWIMKVFNKYFGAFESQKKDWEKLIEKSDAISADGKVLDTKEKFETSRATNYYSKGKKLGDAGKFGTAIKGIVTEMKSKSNTRIDPDFKVPEPKELMNENALAGVADVRKQLPVTFTVTKAGTELADRPGYTAESSAMYGEVAVFTNFPHVAGATTHEDLLAGYKAAKVSILAIDAKAKAKDEVKLDFADAQEVSALASTYVDAMTAAIDLVRGDAMKKMSASLDKAAKDLKKWAKETPSDDATSEDKAVYRQAVSLVTSWVGMNRRLGIETANSFAKYMLSCSQAHYTFASASLKQHKKPE